MCSNNPKSMTKTRQQFVEQLQACKDLGMKGKWRRVEAERVGERGRDGCQETLRDAWQTGTNIRCTANFLRRLIGFRRGDLFATSTAESLTSYTDWLCEAGRRQLRALRDSHVTCRPDDVIERLFTSTPHYMHTQSSVCCTITHKPGLYVPNKPSI